MLSCSHNASSQILEIGFGIEFLHVVLGAVMINKAGPHSPLPTHGLVVTVSIGKGTFSLPLSRSLST